MKKFRLPKNPGESLYMSGEIDSFHVDSIKTADLIDTIALPQETSGEIIRIVLYSHDTMGLGHIRRNLLIAQALTRSDANVDILLVTGSREVGSFPIPANVDCLVLPSLYKKKNGQYRSRYLRTSLRDVISLRSKILSAAIIDFEPDVLIADNVACGALCELKPVLEYLHSNTDTQLILGLRDICDTPAAVRHDWHKHGTEEVLRRYYDEIWVYGDPAVYDPTVEYDFPADVAAKIRFTGYLDQRDRPSLDQKPCSDTPYILCMVGGGQDGAQLAETFVETELPDGLQGVLLCGPHMEERTRQQLHYRAGQNNNLTVIDFLPEPGKLIQEAEAIVCMGGYNSVSEALSYNKRTLIVPRVQPRQEQLIRAQKLAELNITNMLHPDRLHPGAMNEHIHKMMATPQTDVHDQIDFGGLRRLPDLLTELLSPASGKLLCNSR